MKRIVCYITMLCFMLVVLSSCGEEKSKYTETMDEESGVTLYYLNSDSTGLLEYWYEFPTKPSGDEEAVKMIMKQLKESPDLSEYKAVITDSMGFQKVSLQDSYISLDFSAGYAKLEPTMEILCRAAIVKSVTQLPRVSNVEITINGQPITNQDNQVVGIMNGDSFISEDTGLSSYGVYGEISLYFADSSGEKLVEYQTQLDMESNSPIEKKVIEQLIEGPKDSKLQSTIPEGTKVIKTSLKDGVCYVDLNAKFLNGVPGVNDELVVYSIVDSLVELPTINKVQFTIEGQRVAKYRETIPFDGTFERNLDIIKKKH